MSDNQLLFLMIAVPTAIVWWAMIRAEGKQAQAFMLGYERGLADGRASRTKS